MASRAPSRARLLQLHKLRCSIFEKPFNPDNVRMGQTVLRESLKGDLVKDYYFPSNKTLTTKMVKRATGLDALDPDEVTRFAKVEALKRRGKGAPKKQKEKRATDKKKK